MIRGQRSIGEGPRFRARQCAFVPLRDERAPRSFPNEFGHLFLTSVPLLPYVTIPYERLDESLSVAKQDVGQPALPPDELFSTTMAKAIADDLRGSELFSGVEFGADGSQATDYVLTGTLRSTDRSAAQWHGRGQESLAAFLNHTAAAPQPTH